MGENGQRKILIVDDEDLVRWSLRKYLELEGFCTLEASSGEEAMSVLQSEPVDILITDLIMPQMDGFELIRRVRDRLPQVHVLVITANCTPQTLRQAEEAGALRTFSKPIPFQEVAGVIGSL